MKTEFKMAAAFVLALFIMLLMANYPYTSPMSANLFTSGNDTLSSITSVDTVKWQIKSTKVNAPATWNTLSTYITGAVKTGETSIAYDLANETNWTYAPQIRFAVITPAGDSLKSDWVSIGERLGALTLFVQPDTIGAPQDSTLYKVYLEGQ